MEEKQKKSPQSLSRRGFLTGTGIFVAGGIAGYGASLALPSNPKTNEPPPLPFKWTKLEPLEAGRLAYRSYLKKRG